MARPRLEQPLYYLFERDGRFYVRWREEGKLQRVSTGETERRRATVWLQQFIAGRGTPEPPTQPTVSEILDGYLADRKPVVRAYETLEVCAKPLRRWLGDLQPEHLTKERSRFYARQRRVEGHMVGPRNARRKKPTQDGTIIRELVMLRSALAWAKKTAWIGGDLPYIEVPRQPPGRERWLTRDEAARLIEHAQAPHISLFIALALYTAGRTSAILELTWDRIDFVTGIISLGHGHGNKRRGLVPMTETLRRHLMEAREAAISPLVVEHGGRPIGSIKKGFTTAARRAGIDDISPHILRHTAVTWMVMAGIPYAEVARFAAMTVQMVEKRYGHHSPDYLRRAARALEA